MNFKKPQPITPILPKIQDGATTAVTELTNWTTTLAGCTEVFSQKSEKGLKQLKQKKCKVCKTLFTPNKPLQAVCSVGCALGMVDKRIALEHAKERRETVKADKVKREKLKSRADWAKEAQKEVNRYVRLRDMHLGCVSCDKPATWDGQWHASHFRSVGAASAVRFNLWNIHKACSVCNNWKSGNLSEYEPRLTIKIGADKVEWLRTQNQVISYSVNYLTRIKTVFAKKAKRLQTRLQ